MRNSWDFLMILDDSWWYLTILGVNWLLGFVGGLTRTRERLLEDSWRFSRIVERLVYRWWRPDVPNSIRRGFSRTFSFCWLDGSLGMLGSRLKILVGCVWGWRTAFISRWNMCWRFLSVSLAPPPPGILWPPGGFWLSVRDALGDS